MSDARCAVCGEPLAPGLPEVRDPQTREIFSILRCTDCGLGHTTPRPSDLARYYGATYFAGRHGMSEKFCMARRLRFVRALSPGRRLLDFGCGDGGFLAAVGDAGFDATGVDVESRHARARGLVAVDRLDDVSGSFDVVTLWHSLEHVAAPADTMRALAARVAPGGHVVVAVPNFASLQARCFGAGWFHLDVPRHLYHFTRRALERLFAAFGLAPVRNWATESELDLFGWSQSALNALFPAHPNVLFDVMTHRRRSHGALAIGASLALGSVATVLAAPLLPVANRLDRGAVLVMAARKA